MENRLFIASYEDIQIWGSRPGDLINSLRTTDQIFLIANQELNKAKAKIIEDIKNKAHVRIMELGDQNSGILGMMLLIEFLKKEENKYELYIIGASLKCIYEDSDELKKYALDVMWHHTFQVRNVKSKREKEKEKDEEIENAQLFLDAMLGNDGVPESIDTTTVNNQEKKQNGKENKKKLKKDQTKSSSSQVRKSNVSLTKRNVSVEQEIFGSAIESKEYQEFYTELQDSRAHFIANLQDRTESHIRQALFNKKSTITLTQEQFYDFITLMMSSDNAEMFVNSWASQHNLNLDMDEETFQSMYPEIKFFNDVCELLYDYDFWED